MIVSSYLQLDMLSTLLIWIGALGRGKPPCGDMSIVDVPHMFKEYDVSLVSFLIIRSSKETYRFLPLSICPSNLRPETLFELTFPEPDGPPIHVTPGMQLTPYGNEPPSPCFSRSLRSHSQSIIVISETSIPPQYALCGHRHRAISPGPFVVAGIDPDAPAAQAPTLAHICQFLGGGFYIGPAQQGVHAIVNKTPAITSFRVSKPQVCTGSFQIQHARIS